MFLKGHNTDPDPEDKEKKHAVPSDPDPQLLLKSELCTDYLMTSLNQKRSNKKGCGSGFIKYIDR